MRNQDPSSERIAQPTRAVGRALELLRVAAASEGLGLVELARRVNLSPTTTQRLLRTLVAEGFLARGQEGEFFSGPSLVEVAIQVLNGNTLYRIAGRHLDSLRDEFDESAYLGVGSGENSILYAYLAESSQSIRHRSWLGRTVPIDETAIGAAYRELIDPKLRVAIQRKTIDGDSTAIAAPIYWGTGRIAGAISVVGPSYRISEKRMTEIGGRVSATSVEISRDLGWAGKAAAEERDA